MPLLACRLRCSACRGMVRLELAELQNATQSNACWAAARQQGAQAAIRRQRRPTLSELRLTCREVWFYRRHLDRRCVQLVTTQKGCEHIMPPKPRSSGSRHRMLFENSKKLRAATTGHPHLMEEYEYRQVAGAPAIVAHSYRALIRAVGFFKYNTKHQVLMRGQTRCYKKMSASLNRRPAPPSNSVIEAFLSSYRTTFSCDVDSTQRLSTEPLLQHYGIDTRWLDVVDSVPHALFFATYELAPSHLGGGLCSFVPSTEEYGFVYLFDLGSSRPVTRLKSPVSGYFRSTKDLYIADLRSLKPSIALRPHVQHGLLIRNSQGSADIWDRIIARIAVPAREARSWITARAFEPDELFPSRQWDGIYAQLLSAKMTNLLAAESAGGRSWGQVLKFDFHR